MAEEADEDHPDAHSQVGVGHESVAG